MRSDCAARKGAAHGIGEHFRESEHAHKRPHGVPRITDIIRMNRDAMTPAIADTTAAQVAVDQRRVSALAPNTRNAYGSAWSACQRWALDQGRPVLPGTAADAADYLEARHAAGASPATIRLARAAVAKVHQVSGAADPTADRLVNRHPQADRP